MLECIDLLNKKYEIEYPHYCADRNRTAKPEPNERGHLNTGPLSPRDCLNDSDYSPGDIGYRNYPTDLLWERKYSDTGSEDVAVETSKAVIEAAKKRVDEIVK